MASRPKASNREPRSRIRPTQRAPRPRRTHACTWGTSWPQFPYIHVGIGEHKVAIAEGHMAQSHTIGLELGPPAFRLGTQAMRKPVEIERSVEIGIGNGIEQRARVGMDRPA